MTISGHSIQTNTPVVLNDPCKPLEEVFDPQNSNNSYSQSYRPRNDATFGSSITKIIIILFSKNINNIGKHEFESFLLTHIDADIGHMTKLHVDYPKAVLNTDTS